MSARIIETGPMPTRARPVSERRLTSASRSSSLSDLVRRASPRRVTMSGPATGTPGTPGTSCSPAGTGAARRAGTAPGWPGWPGPAGGAQLVAGAVGQHRVEQDDLGALLVGQAGAVVGRPRLQDLVALGAQGGGPVRPRAGVSLDDQHACDHGCSRDGAIAG